MLSEPQQQITQGMNVLFVGDASAGDIFEARIEARWRARKTVDENRFMEGQFFENGNQGCSRLCEVNLKEGKKEN